MLGHTLEGSRGSRRIRNFQTISTSAILKEERSVANQVGKRYVCKKCGAEFIVPRGGTGTLHCCGQPMELKK
jgi:ribosomal protein L37AE/L43A